MTADFIFLKIFCNKCYHTIFNNDSYKKLVSLKNFIRLLLKCYKKEKNFLLKTYINIVFIIYLKSFKTFKFLSFQNYKFEKKVFFTVSKIHNNDNTYVNCFTQIINLEIMKAHKTKRMKIHEIHEKYVGILTIEWYTYSHNCFFSTSAQTRNFPLFL